MPDAPTPITDAASFNQGGRYVDESGNVLDPVIELVHAHIARRLERRVAELEAGLRKLVEIDDGDTPGLWPHAEIFAEARALLGDKHGS